MKILDVLHLDTIIPDLKSHDKKGVLEELSAVIAKASQLDPQALFSVLMEREGLGSTGIGGGIGIPHGKIPGLTSMIIGFGLSKRGVDFDSIDGRPTHLFFTLITPDQSTGLHLKFLARISRLLKNEGFKRQLMKASRAEDIMTLIQSEDDDF